jgi:flagellar hook assembly protein FlgD
VATPAASPTPRFPFEGPIGIDLTTFGAFFDQGEPIQLAITVAVRDPMTLYYRTSQRYDLTVADSEGQEVWRWSRDRTFAQVTEEVELGENGTLSFAETWDQRDNDGQQVPPGNYQVVAESSHCDANYENCGQLTASATIKISSSQG